MALTLQFMPFFDKHVLVCDCEELMITVAPNFN